MAVFHLSVRNHNEIKIEKMSTSLETAQMTECETRKPMTEMSDSEVVALFVKLIDANSNKEAFEQAMHVLDGRYVHDIHQCIRDVVYAQGQPPKNWKWQPYGLFEKLFDTKYPRMTFAVVGLKKRMNMYIEDARAAIDEMQRMEVEHSAAVLVYREVVALLNGNDATKATAEGQQLMEAAEALRSAANALRVASMAWWNEVMRAHDLPPLST